MTGVEYAGAGRRLAALLINGILLGVVITCGLLAWMAFTGKLPDTGSRAFAAAAGSGAVLVVVAKVMLDAWLQGTPGLHLMDCRIVDTRTGRRIGAARSVKRTLGLIVAVLPAFLGLLWMIWNSRRQGWHDLFADAVVIREDESRKALYQLAREAR
jgi:uncharacterized RDD family membrane protein YckC